MRNETTILINLVLAMVLIGVLMAYSTPNLPQDPAAMSDPSSFGFPVKHMIYVGLGAAGMLFAMVLNYTNYAKRRWLLYTIEIAVFACLVWVLIQNVNIRGGVRWLSLGFFSFQPSEIAKFAMILWMAVKLAEHQAHIKEFRRGFLPSLSILGVFCVMVVLQKDLGTSVVMGATGITMILVAGANLWYVAIASILGAGCVTLFIISTPWRLQRVKIFLDPFQDPNDAGYQLVQSLTAFAGGGLRGRGLGASEQKLGYLPDAHSDFIFPIWAEETGLIGSLTLVVLFIAFMAVAFRIALNAKDRFGVFLGVGIATLISAQAFLNLCVTTSLVPTKGLPLPFISEGGTALVMNMVLVGVLMNIGFHASPSENQRPTFETAKATR